MFYYNYLRPCIIVVITTFFSIHSAEKPLPNKRPDRVQAAVNTAFEQNRNATTWGYNGNPYYSLLNLNEDELLKYIIASSKPNKETRSKEKTTANFIDIGCGDGSWGKQAMKTILNNKSAQESGKRFHIFSITGGNECDEVTKISGYVTLHQLNQFKIENIDEEFSKRGYDLKNKANLIVSSWTFRHLADPFGTLKRIYSLLTPERGILLSNGFLFKFDDSKEIEDFPLHHENIFSATNTVSLFRKHTVYRDLNQFLLLRNDHEELKIPLGYTGEIEEIDSRYQCASKVVTIYKRDSAIANQVHSDEIEEIPSKKTYCTKDKGQNPPRYIIRPIYKDIYYLKNKDRKSADLYTLLKSNKLFCKKEKWSQT